MIAIELLYTKTRTLKIQISRVTGHEDFTTERCCLDLAYNHSLQQGVVVWKAKRKISHFCSAKQNSKVHAK